MKIAIVGYGRMGKTIEKIAVNRGHTIGLKIGIENVEDLNADNLKDIDVAIEFTQPNSALNNLKTCFAANVPVVCGTTAWLDDWDKAIESMTTHNGTFLYASNFSVGVNIFFAINEQLAKYMNAQSDYNPSIHEIHHTGKLDAPSGTGITLGEGILKHLDRKSNWTKSDPSTNEILISSERVDPAPGTHHVKYTSAIDDIELIHTAKSRDGFALGAVLAAEYIQDKKGLFTMNDVLQLI